MVDSTLSMHVCFDFSYLELGHDDLVPVWQRPLYGQLQGLAARELGVRGTVLVYYKYNDMLDNDVDVPCIAGHCV